MAENTPDILNTKPWVNYFFWGLLTAVVFYRSPELEFFGGFDGSFRYFFAKQFESNRLIFKDVVYSIGPLMTLKWPSYLGQQLEWSLLYEVACRMLITCYIFSFRFSVKGNFLLFFFAMLIIQMLASLDVLLVYVGLMVFIKFVFLKLHPSDFIAAIILLLGILIKTSITVPLGWIAICFLIAAFYFRNVKIAIAYVVILLFTFSFISWIFFKDARVAFQCILNSLKSGALYSSASDLYGNENKLTLIIAALFAVSAIFSLRSRFEKEKFKMFLLKFLLIGLAFLFWKYSVGRIEGSHAFNFITFLLTCFSLVLVLPSLKNRWLTIIFFVSSFMIYKAEYEKLFGKFNLFVGLKPGAIFYIISNREKLKDSAYHNSMRHLPLYKIDNNALAIIGQDSVGVFPYELDFDLQQPFNMAFRPCLQSSCFGYFASRIDSAYWAKKKPPFILWHNVHPESESLVWVPSSENEILTNDDFPLFQFIRNNYKFVYRDSFDNNIYQLSTPIVQPPIKRIKSINCKMGKPITTTADSNMVFYSKTIYSKTDRLEKFLYKAPQINITYYLRNAEVKKHNITEIALSQGIPVSRYFINPRYEFIAIDSFKIEMPLQKTSRNFTGVLISK